MHIQQAPISVVIPAHNEAERIGQTIKSLLAQSVIPYEIILVDNASTDSTFFVTSRYKKQCEQMGIRYFILKESRLGVANARIKGFNNATQPYIASTDADCIVDKHWIESIYKHFSKTSDVAVTGKIIFHDGFIFSRIITQFGWFRLWFSFTKIFFGFPYFSTANGAIRQSTYKKAGGFTSTITSTDSLDDFELASRVSKIGTIGYNSHMIVYSSLRRYSNSRSSIIKIIKRWKSMLNIKKKRDCISLCIL